MATATSQQKALRIGIVRGGKMVEERLFPGRTSITIGTSSKNTFVLPQSNLPESVVVFQPEGIGMALVFDEGTRGHLEGPGAADLDVVARGGKARRQGARFVLPVTADQRGRLSLGEATLLWQFVTPPPEAPRLVLPPEARRGHFQTLDRLFVTILAISLALHVAGYVLLANTTPRDEVTLEEIPDRFAKLLIPERKAEPPKKKEEPKPEPVVEVAEPNKEEPAKKEEPKKEPGPKVVDKAERAAEVRKAVQSKGILRVLGTLGPGGATGAVRDVFGSGGGFGDVATALSGAGGVAIATDPSAGGGRKGAATGAAATIGDLATSGGGKVALGAKAEARVSGNVSAEDAELDSSEIDQGRLGGFVRARITSIKACYENALKRNPALRGKIRIRFTILATGGLADIAVIENGMGTPDVAACIIGFMRGWRTPFHPSGTVTVEYPFVFSPSL